MALIQSIFGIVLLTLVAALHGGLLRHQQYRSTFKLIATGIIIQFVLGVVLLKVQLLQGVLVGLNSAFTQVSNATEQGTRLVFGYLGGGTPPFEISKPQYEFILAFRALPLVLVFSVLSALMWYWGITKKIVAVLSFLLEKTFGVSGSVGYAVASSIFVGMVESPLLVKNYLKTMTRSELFMVMTSGMATIAGTVLALYASFLEGMIDRPVIHLLVASVMSAPAAIMFGLLIKPEEENKENTQIKAELEHPHRSAMEAISVATRDGLALFLNIIASLIVFIALVYLANQILGLVPLPEGTTLTLQKIIGTLLVPLLWCIGIPWQDMPVAIDIMGTKVAINSLVGYLQLAAVPVTDLTERSRVVLTYTLCGFANFGSLGIMIGGMCAMCQERTEDILKLAPLSVWSGLLSAMLTGAVAGVLLT